MLFVSHGALLKIKCKKKYVIEKRPFGKNKPQGEYN